MENGSVWTVRYFVGGDNRVWQSGITSKKEAEKVKIEVERRLPRAEVSLGYGVDQS